VNTLIRLTKHVICVVSGAKIHQFAHHIKRKNKSGKSNMSPDMRPALLILNL
jgi:hypothetical protein